MKGTWVSASAHIITAVIGSGVLSLSWGIAQLGWIAGPIALVIFSVITWFTSILLADCCRDPVSGTRCSCYMDAVKSNLGGINNKFCGIAQYVNLVGVTIGYSITSAISMAAIKRSGCFHNKGHAAGCHVKNNMFIITFGIIEIILSQIPNFHDLSWLSVVAAVMSFAYSCIGVGLSIAKVAGGSHASTSLTGTTVGVDVTNWQKIWNCLEALGNIAFAYAFSNVLIEIQASLLDTLKSSPPENESMKKATSVGVSVTTVFYISCGVLGYAAFGNAAPGNFLTGFGFYEPYWLIDIANLCIIIHLVGAYQYFQGCMANSLCDNNNCGGDDSPVLQRHSRPARCRFVLAVDCVLPDPNAHSKRKHSTILLEMDMAKRPGGGLLDYIGSSSGWLHCCNR
ncbi:hypothetical protein V6N12_042011 [Hibiscus sabdariffa]|uniref:Amino acid transporter transmembrane domain-containing protein n=1 Tax=Hibiscus sabdariffa TaxID=183260 RepID=A0ABR2EDJ1_9ROSI